VLSLRKNVCWHTLKRARYVELFFRVCVLNRTSVYLHSFVYVIGHLRTAIFILAHYPPPCKDVGDRGVKIYRLYTCKKKYTQWAWMYFSFSFRVHDDIRIRWFQRLHLRQKSRV